MTEFLQLDASNDPRANVSTPSTRSSGIGISISSAIASIIGSIIVIIVILRSKEGLKKVYHRIIFLMSLFDLFQSVAIAFSTLPMPKDMIYNFEGPVYGNEFTCNIQGFAYCLSTIICLYMNGLLCTYYFCSIRLNMTDEAFRKKIELYLYILSVLFSVPMVILAWHNERLNPNPWKFPWCAYSIYPYWCLENDQDCFNEEGKIVYFNAAIIIIVFIVLGSMICIVVYVYKREKLLLQNRTRQNVSMIRMLSCTEDIKVAKTILVQALMYTLIFLAVWHGEILQTFNVPGYSASSHDQLSPTAHNVFLFFRPLQGFGNMIIFVYYKICNIRRSDVSTNFIEALGKILFSTDSVEDHVLSNLSLVHIDDHIRRIDLAVARRNLFDESAKSSSHNDNVEELERDSNIRNQILSTNVNIMLRKGRIDSSSHHHTRVVPLGLSTGGDLNEEDDSSQPQSVMNEMLNQIFIESLSSSDSQNISGFNLELDKNILNEE